MKKNALAVLLPVAAGVALSGTGFGVWVFNKDIEAQNAYAGLQVEPAITLESMDEAIVTVTNSNDPDDKNNRVIFDQDYIGATEAWTIDIDCTINYSTINGIIGTTTKGSTSWDTGTKLDEAAIKAALSKVTVTATPDFKGGVATYVKSVGAIEKKLSDIDVADFLVTEGKGNVTINFEFKLSPSNEYNSIKTLDKYTEMKKAMSTTDTYLGFNIKLVNGYVA